MTTPIDSVSPPAGAPARSRRRQPPSPRPPQAAVRPWLSAGLVAIAAGLALLAALGPLIGDVIDYRVTETLRNQTIGLDATSLSVVVPLACVAAALVRRGHAAGAPMALGIGAYTAYMLAQYVLGPDYGRLPGDNERLFPLLLALFALGWGVAVCAWCAIAPGLLPGSDRRERTIARRVLPVLACAAFLRYVPALADAMSSSPRQAGYLAGPAFFWTIALLDLGVFLPLTIAACAGVPRGRPWARKTLYLVTGWFGLVGPAVAAMGIAMWLNGDPHASAADAAFMAALGLAFATCAIWLFRPLFRTT